MIYATWDAQELGFMIFFLLGELTLPRRAHGGSRACRYRATRSTLPPRAAWPAQTTIGDAHTWPLTESRCEPERLEVRGLRDRPCPGTKPRYSTPKATAYRNARPWLMPSAENPTCCWSVP